MLEACGRTDCLPHESQSKVLQMRPSFHSPVHVHTVWSLRTPTHALPLKLEVSTHNATGGDQSPDKWTLGWHRFRLLERLMSS